MSRTEPRFGLAYIGGTFDCLHSGHIALFRNACKVARKVAVAVNTDEFAERYKRKPLMPLAERLAVLGAILWIDHVVVNEGDEDSKPAILRVRPDCIVHGDDWTGESLMRQMQLTPEFLRERRIEMVYLPYTQGVSTSKLRGVTA